MLLSERNGLRVEVTDPAYIMGVHCCWIIDKRPNSPTPNIVLAFGKGDTPGAAVDDATEILAHYFANGEQHPQQA